MPESKPCLLWEGAKTKAGYGLVTRQRKNYYTHRLAWEDAHGKIPAGMCVLHRCDTPACCEVEHLFLGTKADNVRDMDAKGRRVSLSIPRKLTDTQVRAICASNAPNSQLAAQFNVTPQYVGQLKRGEWRANAVTR